MGREGEGFGACLPGKALHNKTEMRMNTVGSGITLEFKF